MISNRDQVGWGLVVVFLLLLVLAVLLFGADAVKGFALGLTKFAGLVVAVAVVFGLTQGLPGWVWGILAALVVGVFALLGYWASQWPAAQAEMEERNKAHREAFLADIRARQAAAKAKKRRNGGRRPGGRKPHQSKA